MNSQRFDRGTVLGLILAGCGLAAGLVLDGGSVHQVLQPTAALIVFIGTLGAVMVQFPSKTVLKAAKHLRSVIFDESPLTSEYMELLVGFAVKARKKGMVSLDEELEGIDEPFLRKTLTLAVDGTPIRELREMMEIELDIYNEKEQSVTRVFEAAGGFAPTMGIIGAIMGLIQVMQRLDNISEVGKGIAVAFVATLYGIGSANLLFLPLAGKLAIRMRERQVVREMTLDAVISIAEGISARALKQRLESYLEQGHGQPAMRPTVEMSVR